MEINQNEEMEIDLRDLFFVMLNKIWLIILATVVGAVVVALYTMMKITPIYSSTSMMYIMSGGTDLSSLSISDLQVGSALTSDYMVLVTSRPVVNKVIDDLELDMSYETFVSKVSTANPTNTRILKITVTNADAYMAKAIVDDLTEVAASRTAVIMDTVEPNIVEEGTVATSPISPSLKKNAIEGGLVGFVLAAAVIVITFLMNDSIKTVDDIEKYLGMNTLGTIPLREGSNKNKKRFLDRFKKKKD